MCTVINFNTNKKKKNFNKKTDKLFVATRTQKSSKNIKAFAMHVMIGKTMYSNGTTQFKLMILTN